jgi:hypothetical protein
MSKLIRSLIVGVTLLNMSAAGAYACICKATIKKSNGDTIQATCCGTTCDTSNGCSCSGACSSDELKSLGFTQ